MAPNPDVLWDYGTTSELLMGLLSKVRLSAVRLPAKIRSTLREALGLPLLEPLTGVERIPSGSPAQIIQGIFDQAFHLLSPRLVQLLVEEANSGRMFLWHSEAREGASTLVNSEEFDHTTADPYLQLMPVGDWLLQLRNPREPFVRFDRYARKQVVRTGIPKTLVEAYSGYTSIMSVGVDLGDEWYGRFMICDRENNQSIRKRLYEFRHFTQTAARSIHRVHFCMRACRETAAEERARLARELHDGTIQSLLGVELRLESLKRRLEARPEVQKDVEEVQDILRREAKDLRNLVNDSRRRALRPERLLEFLSDLLERFQRDTGVVTRFFADLHHVAMPPRICHEIARMAEEGITNAQKHGRAASLTVRVGSVGNNWLLVIVDDGIGFDFRGTWSLERLVASGFGPRVIKERVLSLDGNLIIESTPTGARIEISIPKSGQLSRPVHQTNSIKARRDDSYSSTAC